MMLAFLQAAVRRRQLFLTANVPLGARKLIDDARVTCLPSGALCIGSWGIIYTESGVALARGTVIFSLFTAAVLN